MRYKLLWTLGLVLAALLTFTNWGGSRAQGPVRTT